MYINKTSSAIVLGRFTIKSGDSFSGLGLSAKEKAGLENLVKKGMLEEWEGTAKQVVREAAEKLTNPTLATDYQPAVQEAQAAVTETSPEEDKSDSKKSSKKK